MKEILKKVGIMIVSFAIVLGGAFALPAYADDCVEDDSTGAGKACGGLKKVSGDNDIDLLAIVGTVINTVFVVIGIVAAVMIILGGFNYATSQGDPNKTAKAKNTIIYSVVGLVVTLLAFAIVNFVLGALQAGSGGE